MAIMYCAANCSCPGQYCSQYGPYSGTTSGAPVVWSIWVDQGTASTQTTSSTASNTIWCSWVDNSYTGTATTCTPHCTNIWPMWVTQQEVTREQLEAIQQRQHEMEIAQRRALEEQQQQALLASERRNEANKKAMELLLANLSAKQKKALKKHGWFLVQGGKSGKTYRIKGDRCSGNITELDGKVEVARYCVHASHEYPLGDQLLAQALSLRHDEEHVLSKANKTPLRQAA